jgi:hypothetical protein
VSAGGFVQCRDNLQKRMECPEKSCCASVAAKQDLRGNEQVSSEASAGVSAVTLLIGRNFSAHLFFSTSNRLTLILRILPLAESRRGTSSRADACMTRKAHTRRAETSRCERQGHDSGAVPYASMSGTNGWDHMVDSLRDLKKRCGCEDGCRLTATRQHREHALRNNPVHNTAYRTGYESSAHTPV